MSLKTKVTDTSSFSLPPEDAHPAVCVAVVDLGTHTGTFKDTKNGRERDYDSHKILIAWELLGPRRDGGDPFVLGRAYTLALGPTSALRKLLKAWFAKDPEAGTEFDPERLLGLPCLLTVAHQQSKSSERTFASIANVAKLPDAMKKGLAKPVHRPVFWEIDGADQLPEHLHDWLPWVLLDQRPEPALEAIRRSQEWRAKTNEKAPIKVSDVERDPDDPLQPAGEDEEIETPF